MDREKLMEDLFAFTENVRDRLDEYEDGVWAKVDDLIDRLEQLGVKEDGEPDKADLYENLNRSMTSMDKHMMRFRAALYNLDVQFHEIAEIMKDGEL